jgi:acyl-CoA hydrolase
MIGPASRLVDIVFPNDTNHHGTLFGGTGLSHLDKVAFVAATRHARMAFVTASCERIDFGAPARLGEIVEAEGRVIRVGRRSMGVEAVLMAENLLTGERRECTRGVFNMVAVPAEDAPLRAIPPLGEAGPEVEDDDLTMVEMVFPGRTNHYGTLFGGEALAMMGKAAFVASTRALRAPVMMASSQQISFQEPIDGGDIVELKASVAGVEDKGAVIRVELWAENVISGQRRRSAGGEFRMRVL